MCGWGATSIGLPEAKLIGPNRSKKHHGPTMRRWRTGKILRTVRAPTSAERAGKDSKVRLAGRSAPAVSAAGKGKRLLIRIAADPSVHTRAKPSFLRRCRCLQWDGGIHRFPFTQPQATWAATERIILIETHFPATAI